MAHHVWREHNSRNCLINSSLYGLHTVSSLCSFCSTSHFIQRHSYSICNYQLFECFFWCWLTRVVPDKIQTALTIVCVSVCTCLFCLVRHNKTLARHHLVTSVIILEHRRKNVGFVHIRCRSDGWRAYTTQHQVWLLTPTARLINQSRHVTTALTLAHTVVQCSSFFISRAYFKETLVLHILGMVWNGDLGS